MMMRHSAMWEKLREVLSKWTLVNQAEDVFVIAEFVMRNREWADISPMMADWMALGHEDLIAKAEMAIG